MLKRNKLTWIRWTVTYWFRNSFLLNEKCLYKNLKIFLMSWFFRIYQEFSRILEKFHFSISISRQFHFTFHSRSRSWDIFISLFTLDLDIKAFSFHFSFSKLVNHIFISLLEMSEPDFHFTFHFSNFQYPLSQDTDVCAPKSKSVLYTLQKNVENWTQEQNQCDLHTDWLILLGI